MGVDHVANNLDVRVGDVLLLGEAVRRVSLMKMQVQARDNIPWSVEFRLGRRHWLRRWLSRQRTGWAFNNVQSQKAIHEVKKDEP